ncbi:MAG: hypothetical protein U1F43_11290 [Myxococcota bacterium]
MRSSSLVVALVASAVVTLLGSAAAHAQDLAVELQCWQGATETAILPRLTFDEVAKPHGCKVLISNNTGADLSNVDFTLTFGAHPEVPLISNPALAGYDPGAYYNCQAHPPTGASFRPSMVLNVNAAFPGFPTGVTQGGRSDPYGPRCFDYDLTPRAAWRVSVAAGATETLRVEFRSGFLLAGAQFQTALRLDVGNLPNGLSVAPRTVPVDVSVPLHPLEADAYPVPSQSPTLSMAGTLWLGTGYFSLRGSQTGVSADFYLPYLRAAAGGGLELAVDGHYDAQAGDLLLYDAADLELNAGYAEFLTYHAARFRDAATGEDTVTAGGLPMPLLAVSDDHYHVDLGHLSGNAADLGTRRIVVSWAAAYNQDPSVQAWLAGKSQIITGRLCGDSDQSGTVCADAVAPLFGEEALLTRLFQVFFDHTSFNQTAERESSAATPFTILDSYIQPSLLPWRDTQLTLVSQVPVNAQGQKGEVLDVRKSGGLHVQRPLFGYYSLAPSDGGHESSLLDRVVPSAGPSDWVALGQLIYDPATPAPAAATEIRTECWPSRYGVRNFGSRIECDPLVRWKVPRNARPSIDHSVYDATDMSHASLGSTARITVRDDTGAVRIDGLKSYYVEVDGGSRYSLNLIWDDQPRSDYQQQRWFTITPDRTTAQYAAVGCVFANLGLDNVKGPLTLTLDWPLGWEPSAVSPLENAVRVVYGDATLAAQGQNWGAAPSVPVPTDRYTVSIDAALRRAVVTFAGPRADGSFPGQDQVAAPLDYGDARFVALRIDGAHVPGVARVPQWTCKATIGESLAPDGAHLVGAEQSLPPDAPFRILGAPAPVLSGEPNPTVVPSGQSWTTTIDLRNAAYDAAGRRLLDGAALSARDSVVYLRVPRDGDVDPATQGGPLAVTYTQARSDEAESVWVATTNVLPAALPASGAELATAAGWRRCALANAPCDAAALAGLGVTPGDVRWVAFALGEVKVTDAAPRGTAPVNGIGRVEAPYLAYVTMTDVASGNGVLARPLGYFASADTLALTPEVDLFDVVIKSGCDACDDSNACTVDTCDVATNTCVFKPVECSGRAGIFAPVRDAAGVIVGAIRCDYVGGVPDCDVGPDTDGDGRPNLVIYPDLGAVCGP